MGDAVRTTSCASTQLVQRATEKESKSRYYMWTLMDYFHGTALQEALRLLISSRYLAALSQNEFECTARC